MNRSRGFTLIELLVVMLVLGILASIALLKYADLRNNAIATQVVLELRAVQVAAFNYYAQTETWPPESGAGAVPTGLGPLLPGQLATSFDRGDYMLDYENFGAGATDVVIGVAVTTSNAKLFAKLAANLGGGAPYFVAGNRITYLIAGPGGAF